MNHLTASKTDSVKPETSATSRDKQISIWSAFHQKPIEERLNVLQTLLPDLDIDTLKTGGLSLSNADLMIENCIGILPIPLGLGLNFKINGRQYQVPMAIEEPSVIAACSSIAKLIGTSGSGFKSICQRPVMIGQIQVLNVDYSKAKYIIDAC